MPIKLIVNIFYKVVCYHFAKETTAKAVFPNLVLRQKYKKYCIWAFLSGIGAIPLFILWCSVHKYKKHSDKKNRARHEKENDKINRRYCLDIKCTGCKSMHQP